jgi:hypothetical protein
MAKLRQGNRVWSDEAGAGSQQGSYSARKALPANGAGGLASASVVEAGAGEDRSLEPHLFDDLYALVVGFNCAGQSPRVIQRHGRGGLY